MLLSIRNTVAWRLSEMEMKHVLLFISLLVLGTVIAEPDTDVLQEDEYHTETKTNGTEEEVTILDKEGHVVGVVDMFEDEGYQIDKPNDGEEHLCLLRTVDEKDGGTNDTNACYVRRALSQEESSELNMSRILDHCGNRSIYILEPQDCDRIDNNATEMSRQKRSGFIGNYRYCCYYKSYPTVICTKWRNYCCRKCRWFCCQWSRTCVRTEIKIITSKVCYHEYI